MSDEPKGPHKAKPPSPRADAPYEVGKGKPPVEHRFKPGNKGGGRPKKSKNRSDHERLLDRRIVVGHDAKGRSVRKTYREVIDLQLLNKAAKGDLAAIKVLKEFEIKLLAIRQRNGPPPLSPEKALQEAQKKLQQERTTAKLSGLLFSALHIAEYLKKFGMAEIGDDFIRLTPRGIAFVNQLPFYSDERDLFQVDLRAFPVPEEDEDYDMPPPFENCDE